MNNRLLLALLIAAGLHQTVLAKVVGTVSLIDTATECCFEFEIEGWCPPALNVYQGNSIPPTNNVSVSYIGSGNCYQFCVQQTYFTLIFDCCQRWQLYKEGGCAIKDPKKILDRPYGCPADPVYKVDYSDCSANRRW